MNIYLSRYYKLINHYKNLVLEGYVEKHHIIPKCIGGDNSPENLVKLPAKAHYVAHHLLCKAYPDNMKLKYAFSFMSSRQSLTSKMYETSKSIRLGTEGYWKNKKRSPETIKKIKIKRANQVIKMTEKWKQNISKGNKGKKRSNAILKNKKVKK